MMNERKSGGKTQEEENLGSFYMGRMRPSEPPPVRVLPKGLLTVVTVFAFAGILYYAYPRGQEKYTDVDIPTISADSGSYKSQPENPGGMEVRHQDSTVFDPLEKKGPEGVEKLLPSAEEPVSREEALKNSVNLDGSAPKLNLDLQMKEVAKGTEKVVPVKEADPEKPAIAAAPQRKPEEKPTVKAAEQKQETKPEVKQEAPVAAKPAAGGTYIQLGSYRDAAGAKTDWSRLQKKFPQVLGGLSMKTERVDLGAKGVWTRLYAGAVSETRAREICAELKAANPGGCIVVK